MKMRIFFGRRTMALATAAATIILMIGVGKGSAATFTVTTLSDSGVGSLRVAITAANVTPNIGTTPDQIQIAANLAPGTIDLQSPLPAITDAVRVINLGTGNGRIELNGLGTRNQTQLSIGLDFQAANCATATPACEVWGFAIDRFGDAGIRVGPHSDNVIITQNYIGTDINGATLNCPDAAHPCGNFNAGILVEGAAGVKIGTDAATQDAGGGGHSNTIAGNFGRGIVVGNGYVGTNLAAGSAVIRNNYIGLSNTFPTAGADIGNTGDGVMVAGTSGNTIGGTTPLSTNYIGGNGANGIEIIPDTGSVNTPASNNIIQGNYIGETLGTVTARGNDGSGIVVRGSNNNIGGSTPGARNVIVANAVNGITISGALATGNLIQGNYIGVASNGTTAMGNQVAGIQIAQYAAANIIGGTGVTAGSCDGPCNVIANNGMATAQSARAGIYIDPTGGIGNRIRENSIFGNGSNLGIGIDLGTPGKNTNDADDADSGPNNLQNKPVLSTANTSKFVTGSLMSTPSTQFTIDFYLNSAADVGNGAQARAWIGSTQVATSPAGTVNFNFTTTVTLPQGSNLTATATRGSFTSALTAGVNGDTSELSDPVTVVTAPTAAAVTVSGRLTDAAGNGLRNATVTMTDMNGKPYSVLTNAFGYFNFAEIPSGESYIVSALRKGYRFDSFMVQVSDSIDDITITARP